MYSEHVGLDAPPLITVQCQTSSVRYHDYPSLEGSEPSAAALLLLLLQQLLFRL